MDLARCLQSHREVLADSRPSLVPLAADGVLEEPVLVVQRGEGGGVVQLEADPPELTTALGEAAVERRNARQIGLSHEIRRLG
ncbi:hypothetical protein SAMN05661080_02132 [Modestobacter sp. DSM 44400]|uniref:hypothetical protein n=1 Tax=Modestobacter sp. DSM 44400 TaxID=1550230 RepID=UPI000899B1D6|nr:hypothetical protein [Modestobacter sp. DSM 44400]SDY04847.1 hypothetical protein SAMN05661080_02132 [Modestobacter sp. DSM 44400]